MKKTLCTIKIHSIVDVITNSSTEIFCVVNAESEDVVREIINAILKECSCHILISGDYGLDVCQHCEYPEDSDNEVIVEGQFDITYELGALPCDLILEKIREQFEIVQEGNY